MGHDEVRRAILAPALFAYAAAAADPVYRTVGDGGAAVFSDAPVPGARPLPARRINVYAAPKAVRDTALEASAARPASAPAPWSYESLDIVSPAAGAMVRANGGEVRVEVRIVPELRRGHRVVLSLDDRPVPCSAAAGTGRFTCRLSAVSRGPNTARVEVVDATGATLLRSPERRFHVLRTAVARRAPIAPRAPMH